MSIFNQDFYPTPENIIAQMPIRITKVEGYYLRPNLTNTLLSASAVFKAGSFKLFTNKLK
jgi:hypothetical protein